MTNKVFANIKIKDNFELRQPRVNSFKQVNEMLECYNDPVMRDFVTSSCLPTDIKGAYELIQYYHDLFVNDNGMMWFLEDLNLGRKFIGTFGFHMIDQNNKKAEISYEIHKNYRHQGLSSLCLKAVCEYGFANLGLHKIEALCMVENHASINFLLKNNFKKDIILKNHQFIHGRYMDFIRLFFDHF